MKVDCYAALRLSQSPQTFANHVAAHRFFAHVFLVIKCLSICPCKHVHMLSRLITLSCKKYLTAWTFYAMMVGRMEETKVFFLCSNFDSIA